MSHEGSSSVKFTRPVKKRNDKGRRSWSQREEEELIIALKEIIAGGWKSENGFKIGYLGVLEQHMVKAFPGTDLRATPHINSKIHVWKKAYGSLFSMLQKSGIGYSENTKMIDATDEAWEQYVRTDPNARLMRFKSWPFYPDWCEIFGKDRATGAEAEDFVDAVNHVINSDGDKVGDFVEHFDRAFDTFNDETEGMSVCNTPASASGQKSSGKKRKHDETSDPLMEAVGSFCKEAVTRLGEIAHRIGHEFDIDSKREKVWEIVHNMEGLSLREKLVASKLLVMNVEDLVLFFTLPDGAKEEFARMKLAGHL